MTYILKPNPKCSTETITAYAVIYNGIELGDVITDGDTLTLETAHDEAQSLVNICLEEGII